MEDPQTVSVAPNNKQKSRYVLEIIGASLGVLVGAAAVFFEGLGKDWAETAHFFGISRSDLSSPAQDHMPAGARPSPAAPTPDTFPTSKVTLQNVAAIHISYAGDSPENPRLANDVADALKNLKVSVSPDPGPNVLSLVVSVTHLDTPIPAENASIGLFKATAEAHVETSIGQDQTTISSFDMPGRDIEGRENVEDGALQDTARKIAEKLRSSIAESAGTPTKAK